MTHIQSYPHVTSFDVEAFKCRLKTLTPIDVWIFKRGLTPPGGNHPLGGIILLHQVERLVSLPWDGRSDGWTWLDRAGRKKTTGTR
jgi:hypothetical protein